jgi:hypothetical protein
LGLFPFDFPTLLPFSNLFFFFFFFFFFFPLCESIRARGAASAHDDHADESMIPTACSDLFKRTVGTIARRTFRPRTPAPLTPVCWRTPSSNLDRWSRFVVRRHRWLLLAIVLPLAFGGWAFGSGIEIDYGINAVRDDFVNSFRICVVVSSCICGRRSSRCATIRLRPISTR